MGEINLLSDPFTWVPKKQHMCVLEDKIHFGTL